MAQDGRRDGDRVGLAVATIVFTVLALATGDALVKLFSGAFPLWQMFILRSAIALPVLALLLLLLARPSVPRPRQPGWTALRSLLLTAMWVVYYAALPHLELAAAAAVYYTSPLVITLLAALFLGDRVGAKGWAAVALGFAGVLLVLRPQAEDFNAFALLPLASALFYAVAMILTRSKCRGEHPLVLALGMNLAGLLAGAGAGLALALAGEPPEAGSTEAFLLGPWVAMTAEAWLVGLVLAAAILIGSCGAAVAYQLGPPAVVATFDFAYVGFAALLGVLLFAEVPDGPSLLGMAAIVAAGLLALRR